MCARKDAEKKRSIRSTFGKKIEFNLRERSAPSLAWFAGSECVARLLQRTLQLPISLRDIAKTFFSLELGRFEMLEIRVVF